MSANKSIFVRVLLFLDEGKTWIAQGLEYDIAAQGKTLKEAQEAFNRMFITKIILDLNNGVDPLSQLSEAPEEYQQMFNETEEQLMPRKEIDFLPQFKDIGMLIDMPPYHIADRRVYA